MSKRKRTSNLVLHCSDSTWGTQREIDKWHRGNGWSGCGYHYVILNGWVKKNDYQETLDGMIEVGRHVDDIGAHVRDQNSSSVGICLIGVKEFTKKQMDSLFRLCEYLIVNRYHKLIYKKLKGHYEFDNKKTCPNLDMQNVRADFTKYLNPAPITTKPKKKTWLQKLCRGYVSFKVPSVRG